MDIYISATQLQKTSTLGCFEPIGSPKKSRRCFFRPFTDDDASQSFLMSKNTIPQNLFRRKGKTFSCMYIYVCTYTYICFLRVCLMTNEDSIQTRFIFKIRFLQTKSSFAEKEK